MKRRRGRKTAGWRGQGVGEAVITPFAVQVAPDEIADLRNRLACTRWTDWLPGAGWSYGVDEAYLKRLCAYWQDGYDFAGYVARLNAWPQYIGEMDGEQIQFYHVRS